MYYVKVFEEFRDVLDVEYVLWGSGGGSDCGLVLE